MSADLNRKATPFDRASDEGGEVMIRCNTIISVCPESGAEGTCPNQARWCDGQFAWCNDCKDYMIEHENVPTSNFVLIDSATRAGT